MVKELNSDQSATTPVYHQFRSDLHIFSNEISKQLGHEQTERGSDTVNELLFDFAPPAHSARERLRQSNAATVISGTQTFRIPAARDVPRASCNRTHPVSVPVTRGDNIGAILPPVWYERHETHCTALRRRLLLSLLCVSCCGSEHDTHTSVNSGRGRTQAAPVAGGCFVCRLCRVCVCV